MLQKANRHILSFEFFKSATFVLLLLGAFIFESYQGVNKTFFPFISGALFAYFPNIEGSQKQRIIAITVGFFWSLTLLVGCLFLFELNEIVQIIGILLLVFISSMVSVYGRIGGTVSFGGLFAIASSFGVQSLNIPLMEAVFAVLFGGLAYIAASALSHFFYQKHHVRSMLADCIELTAKYFEELDTQIWENKEDETQILDTITQINHLHELLRPSLLNKPGILFPSNRTRRQYLIFTELVDLFETTLGSSHDLEMAGEYFDKNDPAVISYRQFTGELMEELRNFGETIRLNRDYDPGIISEKQLKDADFILNETYSPSSFASLEKGLVLKNLIDLKQKQLEKLELMSRHYHNIFTAETIVQKRDPRFITMQDYSFKILLANLNFQSAIFRHSLRLCVAVTISFVLQNILNDTSSWILIAMIIVLRPNYGLTRQRAYNRIMGTILGGVVALLLLFVISFKLALISLAALALMLGFSYVPTRYMLATFYITLGILTLYAVYTGRSYDVVAARVGFTIIGATIALLATYFVFPMWENKGMAESVAKAIHANRKYLEGVNGLYETKEPINNDIKLLRKEAFLRNGDLYNAFQRLKEDPKSKRKQLNNSFALVLLCHSTMKAIAAYSTYIQTHKTTRISEEFKEIMAYVDYNFAAAENVLEGKPASPVSLPNPRRATEGLEKYYRHLSEYPGDFHRDELMEGKVILDQLKSIKSLSENTLQMVGVLPAQRGSKEAVA